MALLVLLVALAAGCAIPQQAPAPKPLFETQGPPIQIARFNSGGRPAGIETVFAVAKNGPGWRRVLSPKQFAVLREGATEPPDPSADREPFPGGLYRCAGCGTALFHSRDRFASGSGWPSFTKPIAPENIRSRWDRSWGVQRRQVACSRCGGALGHVFKDGPAPTYLRYCINSSAMQLQPPGSYEP